MVSPTVIESWQAISAWCAEHVTDLHTAFGGPAAEADIRRAGDEVGAALPDDLVEWWRLVDGTLPEADTVGSLLPPYHNPMSIMDALESRQSWLAQWGNASDLALADGRPDPALAAAGTPCYLGWLPVWLPIARDESGNELFVDLRLGPLHGCVMEFDEVDCASQPPGWPTVRAMLADVANALTTGIAIGVDRLQPQLADGRLEWTDQQPA
jgi:cell wall assembly regulator SMI1